MSTIDIPSHLRHSKGQHSTLRTTRNLVNCRQEKLFLQAEVLAVTDKRNDNMLTLITFSVQALDALNHVSC